MDADLRQQIGDLGQRGRRVVRHRVAGSRLRQGRPVDRVGGGVVDGRRGRAPDDLRVADVRLQLDPPVPVVRQPQPTRAARHQHRASAPQERSGREELVREGHARGHAVDRRAGEGVVEGLCERLRRRRLTAASTGNDRTGSGRHAQREAQAQESEQTGGGERAQVPHGDPSSESSGSGVAPELESSLRAGSSIVKQAPSTNALPPCRSAVARTIARPSPDPERAWSPRQKRSNARSRSAGSRPGPSSQTVTSARPSDRRTVTEMVPPCRTVQARVLHQVRDRPLERGPIAANT